MALPKRRKHELQEYRDRLDTEIEIIKSMGFPGYFLVVWDFIKYAKDNGIPVGPGRGSAAGSLVAYSMGITDVDPLEYDLLFERFLNPERISMPDIDIDFCMNNRGRVIEYVRDKYGDKNVAQIITFGTMAAKSVVRDVGRVLGLPYSLVDKVAKTIPGGPGVTLDDAKKDSPALIEAMKNDAEVAKIIEIGTRLEGLSRHAGMHAAGVVITPEPVTNYVPLYRTNRDEIVTQYDMRIVEKMGSSQDGLPRAAHAHRHRRRGEVGRARVGREDRHRDESRWRTPRSSAFSRRGGRRAYSSSSRAVWSTCCANRSRRASKTSRL